MNTVLYSSVKKGQRTNKNAFIAFVLCLLLLFSSFVYSFASFSDFVFVPYYNSDLTVQNIKDNGEFLLNYSGFDYIACSNNSSPVYACFVGDETSGQIYFLTEGIESGNKVWFSRTNSNYSTCTFTSNTSSSAVYYVNSGSNLAVSSVNNTVLQSYSSIEAAIADFSTVNPSTGPATVSVEAGCVAYILIDGGTANLTTTFPELSKLSRPLWVSGSTYSFEEDLPSSGKVFSSTSGNLIDWLIPANAKKDLLGRSYVGGRPLSDLPTGQYLVVYNPVYRGYDDKGVGIMSPTIYVSLSNYVAVRQYRLTASYNGGIIESTSEDGYTSWFDSIGEEELDANGNPVYIEHKTDGTTAAAINIPAGGGNIIIDTENADNSLGGLLQRLVNLLSAPIRYIEKLFNAGVGFFTMLASLWSWLPEEVSTIIASALVVLIVIGVVKFLWK